MPDKKGLLVNMLLLVAAMIFFWVTVVGFEPTSLERPTGLMRKALCRNAENIMKILSGSEGVGVEPVAITPDKVTGQNGTVVLAVSCSIQD